MKTIKRSSFALIIVSLAYGCNHTNTNQNTGSGIDVDSFNSFTHNEEEFQPENVNDTTAADGKTAEIKTKNPVLSKNSDESAVRMIEFPSDDNFHGRPMVQQENIPAGIYKKNPDTLNKTAIARYKTYDHFFPKSIADNFENGTSTERIRYPEKLIFRFELFENDRAPKPYLIKDITVKRKPNGELYTE